MAGVLASRAGREVSIAALLTAAAGAFVAVLVCVLVAERLRLDGTEAILLAAPFGASAVLVFGGARSPFARPRNVVGGYLVCALSALLARAVLGGRPALAAASCVAVALVAMEVLDVVHPPAGGFALVPLVGTGAARAADGWVVVAVALGGAVVVLGARLLTPRLPLPLRGRER